MIIFLVFASFALLISCGNSKNAEGEKLYSDDNKPDENGKIVYSVNVRTDGGVPLKNITVAVYDKESEEYKGFTPTDHAGNASLKLSPSKHYVLQLYDTPSDCKAEEEYSFTLAHANVVLKTEPKNG